MEYAYKDKNKEKKRVTFDIFNLPVFVSSFFYVGLFPYAPGTAGSIAAFLLYVFLLRFLSPLYYLVLCAAILVAGIYFSGRAAKISGIPDPPFAVIDEVMGYLTAMSGVFWMRVSAPQAVLYALYGLLLFRFFDILKPFPISLMDKNIKGGAGIMLDDVAAGIFSLIALRIIIVLSAGVVG